MLPERFPHESFQTISPGSLAAMLFRNRKSEARSFFPVFPGQDREQRVTTPLRFRKHTAERPRVRQPVTVPESVSRLRFRSSAGSCIQRDAAVFAWPCFFVRCVRRGENAVTLRCQLRTAFRAPPFQHKASGLGRHARTKPVGSRPFQVAWLERAFHCLMTCGWNFAISGAVTESATGKKWAARVLAAGFSVNRTRGTTAAAGMSRYRAAHLRAPPGSTSSIRFFDAC